MADYKEKATALEEQIQANPALMQALIDNQKKPLAPPSGAHRFPGFASTDQERAAGYRVPPESILEAAGIPRAQIDNMVVGVDKNSGQPYVRSQTWFERNAAWVVPVAIVGGGAAAGIATAPVASATGIEAGVGGGSTVAANLGAASALPAAGGATAPIAAAVTTAGATSPTTAAATTAGATAPAVAKKAKGSSIWGDLANVGLNVVDTALTTRAVQDATQAQLDAVNKAIDLQREMYQQSRSDQMPWLQAGQRGISALSVGLGLGPVEGSLGGGADTGGGGTPAATPQTTAPKLAVRNPAQPQNTTPVPAANYTGATAVPRGTQPISSLLAPTPTPTPSNTDSTYTTMRGPDGSMRQVPSQQVSFYQQRGATVVSNG